MTVAERLVNTNLGRCLLFVLFIVLVSLVQASGQVASHVENIDQVGPRPLEKQTAEKVSHYYLEAWKDLHTAFAENQAAALDASFAGVAREKLGEAIHQQQALGITTQYVDRGHDLKFVFYSSEGLSVQLLDNADYDLQVMDHGHVIGTRHMHSRYVAVLTPTEVRWKVRFFQPDF